MKQETVTISGITIPVIRADVVVVGSGAASLNAAVHLKRFGVEDVVVITEKLGGGTSANAGSDKQTYYRLNPGLPGGDAVLAMARDLFSGGCMHGDVALTEAALSERGFYHLVELGVPFPHDEYGGYTGYRTDHDPRGRGTSAGPGTSIQMFEKLRDEAMRLGVEICDGLQAIELFTGGADGDKHIVGLAALDLARIGKGAFGLTAAVSEHIVLGTGGPALLYGESVYPYSQKGSLGMAIKAGAKAQNLTESQFGIASKGFRWNLSGSYQQALPRYVSTAADGGDEREFLDQAFPTFSGMLEAQFLKGYGWPFDVRTINGHGSSCVDLLVYRETILRGRRVFLDYRRNPSFRGDLFNAASIPAVARDFLEKSSAALATPIERLAALNPPAINIFLDHGTDLRNGMLEIALSHQHLNGGLTGSLWWESNIRGLFPVGECNGSHGIYRPGGSALNAGQAGSLRAAQCIAHRLSLQKGKPTVTRDLVEPHLRKTAARMLTIMSAPPAVDLTEERSLMQRRMSSQMGIIRSPEGVRVAICENSAMMEKHRRSGPGDAARLPAYCENEDLLITEQAVLESARLLLENLSGGRGSFIVGDLRDLIPDNDGKISIPLSANNLADRIVQVKMQENGTISARFVPVRPIPDAPEWFETVWTQFRSREFMPR